MQCSGVVVIRYTTKNSILSVEVGYVDGCEGAEEFGKVAGKEKSMNNRKEYNSTIAYKRFRNDTRNNKHDTRNTASFHQQEITVFETHLVSSHEITYP